LNTGSRTDIPAWYGEWFYNRVKEGYVLVKNPYDPTRVTRYRIAPDVVDCICFCTKNPAPMLERLEELDAFRQVWYVTITPYGREIEPRVPSWQQVAQSFARLSHKVGKDMRISLEFCGTPDCSINQFGTAYDIVKEVDRDKKLILEVI